MVKRFLITLLLLGVFTTSNAQSVLTLDSCINQAYRNFEFNKQVEYTNQVTEANVSGIKKNYLPTLDLNAMATYQNEQISIPLAFPIPGFEAPVAPLNINTALFTLRQWIYDGSMTHNQRLIQEASGNVQLQEIGVQKLEVKNSVMQLYFSILLLEKQQVILLDKASVLQSRLKEVDAAVESNVLLASDLDMLKAEIVQLKQRSTEIEFGRKASISGLSQLLGIDISEDTKFTQPEAEITPSTDLSMRPDVKLMDYQMNVLEAQKGMIKSSYLPKIGVFADGGLGYPGYNLFKDEISPMAKVGVSLQWHIFDWNKGSTQRQTLDLSQNILRLKQDRLKMQVGVQREAQQSQIEKTRQLMLNDAELLDLYTSISAAYAAQLENGTITSADYILQLNKEQEARTNLELHKLQLLIATLNYNTIINGE
jgi:outer membrane protein TolC